MARVRPILLVVALTLALGLGVAPARADERVNAMARALRADPVFVSSAAIRSVAPAQVRALRRAVAAAPVPTFVVVAPSFGDEPGLGTFHGLPDLLHDRLERDGIYLAVDLGPSAHAQAFGVEPRFELDGLTSAVYRDRPDAGPGEAARYALALVTTGRRAPVARIPDETVRPAPVVAAGVGAGALGFVVAGWPWVAGWRRRRRERPAAAQLAGAAAPSLAPALDPRSLRDQAHGDLAALSAALAAAEAPPPAAFDGYAAASKLLEDADEDDALSLVAALELTRRADATLGGRPRGPCFFDPRHGVAKTHTRWRLGDEEADIPACRSCARRVAKGRAPQALQDSGRPYFERDTLWARTGFGALDDGWAARVLAGEARR
ncbi:MAG TPA: hypothetical protein VD836_04060 [Solirubrobacteraceae bacterium]|nr:hypothetical protein [Solirubrobacteraceae bacterium]